LPAAIIGDLRVIFVGLKRASSGGMRLSYALAATLPLLSLLTTTDEAKACGGCFVSESESTQVTGHRMVLSISNEQTTLYDQIQYSGDPAEFAWVLPIRGQVDIGLSSDALFSLLEQETSVQINSPFINCPSGTNTCGDDFASAGGGSSAGEDPGGVEIIAQEVVGPYETVQLSASDPGALNNWLGEHGYNIPPSIEPIIDAYVADGFDFLALRLAPGKGVSSMKPVRVTTPGGAPVLPLRMVAAGTGEKTAITLWVMAEGRYEPQNFPSFLIESNDLVWDWDQSRSNYADLRAQGLTGNGGLNWLVEAGEEYYGGFYSLLDLASYAPLESGYADPEGTNAELNAQADIDVLTFGLTNMWINRYSAELPVAGLANDLTLQASDEQVAVQRYFDVANAIGTAPVCPAPPPDPCGDSLQDLFTRGTNDQGAGCSFERSATVPRELPIGLLSLGLAMFVRRRRSR
jgi:hypothetical protein